MGELLIDRGPAGLTVRAVVNDLLDARDTGEPIEDVVWGPGYSLCKPGTVHHKLAPAGIHQTFQAVTHQRGVKPFSGEALLIDGQLFSPLLPQELRDLPVPPRGASEEEKLAYEAKFNQRARWRLTRHAGPDKDGATRWKCPFCSGLLRTRMFGRRTDQSLIERVFDWRERVLQKTIL